MTLIKSISGIRGTLGGRPGNNLTPVDLVQIASGFAQYLKMNKARPLAVVGRDGRISGGSVSALVTHTLLLSGVDVLDLGLTSTPTVEMAVKMEEADGGIIFSASHNPMEWNALKLLNERGEFLSSREGKQVLDFSSKQMTYASIHEMGSYQEAMHYPDAHIDAILDLPEVHFESIASKQYHVVIDAVNSTGAMVIPALLDRLGVTYEMLNGEITGSFAHNPEPLEKHLSHLMEQVKNGKADLGIAVDPDVDRLALVDENGTYWGEEYTLVGVADYLLRHRNGPVVTNLSSSIALRDIADNYGVECHFAEVGEANVVRKMKEIDAVLGGEGNGGVICPQLHYGRDALVGIAFILSAMASRDKKASELRSILPDYHISKLKLEFSEALDAEDLLEAFLKTSPIGEIDTTDGIKIILDKEWVHLRKSNTEPIIRVYAESKNASSAEKLAKQYIDQLNSIIEQL